MAKNRIGRRITQTVYVCDVADKDNNIVEKEVTVYGIHDFDSAERKVKRILDTNRVLIKSIKSQKNFYASMALDDFVSYADISD